MRQFEPVTEDIRFQQLGLAQHDVGIEYPNNKYQTLLIIVGMVAVFAVWLHLAQTRRAMREIETKENNN
ncbi:MAG: hypothetical protein JST70_15715 [Bacteroidetes bacterium]|nr:hypothetical protein [Bacteroidota bacterium]